MSDRENNHGATNASQHIYAAEELKALDALAKEAKELFPPSRTEYWTDIRTLRKAVQEWSESRGFLVKTVGKSLQCTRHDRPNSVVPSKKKRRVDMRCGCLFEIRYQKFSRTKMVPNQPPNAVRIMDTSCYAHSNGCFPSPTQLAEEKSPGIPLSEDPPETALNSNKATAPPPKDPAPQPKPAQQKPVIQLVPVQRPRAAATTAPLQIAPRPIPPQFFPPGLTPMALAQMGPPPLISHRRRPVPKPAAQKLPQPAPAKTAPQSQTTQKPTQLVKNPVFSGSLRAHCVRFHPGDDFVSCLLDAARQALSSSGTASACFVMTCVGSLQQVSLRMASAEQGSSSSNDIIEKKERFEILSLVGTFTPTSAKHLHLCVSDKEGVCFGGHLISGTVFTTVELVLGTAEGVAFDRKMDTATGYQELVVSNKDDDEPS